VLAIRSRQDAGDPAGLQHAVVIRRLARRAALAALLAIVFPIPAWASDRFIEYLYIDANEGGSSGGHVAVRVDDDVFHFEYRRPGPAARRTPQTGRRQVGADVPDGASRNTTAPSGRAGSGRGARPATRRVRRRDGGSSVRLCSPLP